MATARATAPIPQGQLARALAGSFQRPRAGAIEAASPNFQKAPVKAVTTGAESPFAANLLPSLAGVLRRESAGNWLMPYMSAITPAYVESVIRGGLSGNHAQMHQLFDLMWDSDPELQACIAELVDGVQSKKFVITPFAEDDEEPTPEAEEKCKLVKAALTGMRPDPYSYENNLYNTVKDIIAAKFHGASVLEVDWYRTYSDGELNLRQINGLEDSFPFGAVCPRATYWVNPVCYGWHPAGRLMLLLPQRDLRDKTLAMRTAKADPASMFAGVLPYSMLQSTSGQVDPKQFMEFPARKFLVAINNGKTGSPLAVSQLRCLAFWWVAKNFCADYLLKSAELFGVPFRKATYASHIGDTQKREIRQMLQSVGSQGWALLPEGVNLEFESATGQGSASPQAFLFQLADSMIRKIVLRQTMTGGGHDSMGKGGGKAFGDVEADKTDVAIEAAARFACDVINEQLVPWILELNYGEDGGNEAPNVVMVDNEVGGLPDAQRDQTLAQIMDVPTSYLRRKYGVPKPKLGEEVAGVDSGVMGAQAQAQERLQQQQMQQQQDQAQMQADAMAQQQAQVESARAAKVAFREAIEAGASGSSYGCLMATLTPDEGRPFVELAKKIIEDDTLVEDGVETEPHVTVLYGFNEGFDAKRINKLLADYGYGSFTFTLGKLSRFECERYDVLKFEVESEDLIRLHGELAEEFSSSVTPSQHAYHPHLTLAYVAKGSNKGAKAAKFEGKKFTVNTLTYSSPDHAQVAVKGKAI